MKVHILIIHKFNLNLYQKMYDLSPTAEIRVFKTMIYIYVDEKHQGPTIAFKFKSRKGYVFIDASCRVYKSWQDFKENNKLPECKVAYPNNGTFEVNDDGKVIVSFLDSPACSTGTQVLKVTDVTAAVAGVGTTAVALAGLFFPLTAPVSIGLLISGGATGVYSAGRSIAGLVDRSQHEESISLADSEARLHWLNVVTAPLAVAGGGNFFVALISSSFMYLLIYAVATMATSRIAASGQVLSKTAQVIVNTTIFSSFTMTSVNVVNNLANLVEKSQKDELTVLDVTSFVISVAFWTNSAMNLKTANGIIKTTQREVLESYQNNLTKKEARQFKTMVKNTRDDTAPRNLDNPMKRNVHDNAKAIRAMRQIRDPKDFLQSAIKANKEIRKENKVYTKKSEDINPKKMWLSLDDYPGLKEYSCMSINNELKIAPQTYLELDATERKTILKSTIKFINDRDESAFINNVSSVKGIKFEVQRNNAISGFCKILKVSNLQDYKVNGKKLFDNLQPHEKNRLIQVENTLNTGGLDRDRQQMIATKFAEEMKPQTFTDYMSYVEYAIAKQQNDMKNIDITNKPTEMSKLAYLKSEYFKQFFNDQGNLKPNCFQDMKNDFNAKQSVIGHLNDNLKQPFCNAAAATYHTEKHGNGDPVAYMDKVKYVLDNAQPNKLSMTQEGNATIVSYVVPHEESNLATQVLVIINGDNTYTMSMFEKRL
jgi:hypothetical protein